MPTYQYACTDCGHAFEQFQSFSDDALTVCPECSGKLRKLFTAVGVVFKGSGFYRTDSRDKNGAGEKPSEKSGEKPSEKSGEKPSEKSGEKSGEKSTTTPAAASTSSSSSDASSSSSSSTPTPAIT
jgi:putative FmdB family regulatory protein